MLTEVDYHQKPMTGINKDVLDEQLDQYTAFLSSFGANRNSPLEILSEEMGLPTQHVTNALLQGSFSISQCVECKTDLSPTAYTQGFQAGSIATQAKLRAEMPSNAARRNRSTREVPSSPMDYSEVTMSSL